MSRQEPRIWAWTLAVLLLLVLYVWAYFPHNLNEAGALLSRVSPSDARAGLAYVRLIQSGNIPKILASADSSVLNATSYETVRKLIALLPSGPGTSVTLVNENWQWGAKSFVVLTYDIRNQHAWAAFAVTLGKDRAGTKLEGFQVQQFLVPPEQIYGFTFARKAPLEYAALAVAIVIALITWTAAFACALTPRLRFKWLWMVGIFIGLMRMNVDWSTGVYQLAPIAMLVPPATLLKSAYFSPWILQLSVPVVAIVFLLRRKALMTVEPRTVSEPEAIGV